MTSQSFFCPLTLSITSLNTNSCAKCVIESRNHFFSLSCQTMLKVDRGLHELKKLGIESQLWEATRRAFDDESINHGSPFGSEV